MYNPNHRLTRTDRRGVVNVLVAVLMIGLVAMAAFAVDIGYLLNSQEELQRTADSAAMAACWKFGREIAQQSSTEDAVVAARSAAQQFASQNKICQSGPDIDLNTANSESGDLVFGYVADPNTPETFTTTAGEFNAVRIRIRRSEGLNGKVPYTFARIFGLDGQEMEAEATAMLVSDVKGFRRASSGKKLQLLPFALDLETWNLMTSSPGSFDDDWSYDEEQETVSPGPDGLQEMNLFPQGTGSPGNRGTVDIGGSNNSSSDIARQILEGISDDDFDAMESQGRTLEFDDNGELPLNGDTGISAGVKDELESIKGEPRIIPIFSQVQGPGNNAEYTIVMWVGIRIMEVKLTGKMNTKRVMIQKAPIMVQGVIPSESQNHSESIYSPVFLAE